MYVSKCQLWTRSSTVECRIGDHIEMLLKFVLKLAIKDWITNCKLINADYGRVFARSNDGLGIILKFVLEFAIEDWRTNCMLKNADYG